MSRMKNKVIRFISWMILALLLYLLCLFGWIPTITEYNSIDISAVSKAYILGFSIAAAIVFAFSVYYFMQVFIEKEGEKKKIIFAIILMMVYVVGIFLLKLLYESKL